jgi:hypothetical protein
MMCLGILARWPRPSLSSAGWRGQLLGLGLSGDEVHHQDPLRFECRLVPRRRIWLNRGGGLPIGEAASPWRRSQLGGGTLSMGLR